MIVCNKCGNREPDNSKFCSSCSAFLEFDGTYQKTPDAPVSNEPADLGAVTPGERAPQSAVPVALKPTIADGEEPCPAKCGGGNPPSRNYCRYCGAPLRPAAAPTPVKVPWWRRLWKKLFGPKVYQADQRPRAPKPRFRLKKRWIVLVIVLVLGIAYQQQVRSAARFVENEIRDGVQSHAPFTPSKFRASTVLGANAPERLADRDKDGYWAPRGNPVGAWVEVDLPRAIRLLDIIVTPGQSGDAIKFQAQGRPFEVDVILTRSDGTTATKRISVQDKPGPQTFKVKGDNVVKIRLTFVSAHGMKSNGYMAVAELEFFGR